MYILNTYQGLKTIKQILLMFLLNTMMNTNQFISMIFDDGKISLKKQIQERSIDDQNLIHDMQSISNILKDISKDCKPYQLFPVSKIISEEQRHLLGLHNYFDKKNLIRFPYDYKYKKHHILFHKNHDNQKIDTKINNFHYLLDTITDKFTDELNKDENISSITIKNKKLYDIIDKLKDKNILIILQKLFVINEDNSIYIEKRQVEKIQDYFQTKINKLHIKKTKCNFLKFFFAAILNKAEIIEKTDPNYSSFITISNFIKQDLKSKNIQDLDNKSSVLICFNLMMEYNLYLLKIFNYFANELINKLKIIITEKNLYDPLNFINDYDKNMFYSLFALSLGFDNKDAIDFENIDIKDNNFNNENLNSLIIINEALTKILNHTDSVMQNFYNAFLHIIQSKEYYKTHNSIQHNGFNAKITFLKSKNMFLVNKIVLDYQGLLEDYYCIQFNEVDYVIDLTTDKIYRRESNVDNYCCIYDFINRDNPESFLFYFENLNQQTLLNFIEQYFKNTIIIKQDEMQKIIDNNYKDEENLYIKKKYIFSNILKDIKVNKILDELNKKILTEQDSSQKNKLEKYCSDIKNTITKLKDKELKIFNQIRKLFVINQLLLQSNINEKVNNLLKEQKNLYKEIKSFIKVILNIDQNLEILNEEDKQSSIKNLKQYKKYSEKSVLIFTKESLLPIANSQLKEELFQNINALKNIIDDTEIDKQDIISILNILSDSYPDSNIIKLINELKNFLDFDYKNYKKENRKEIEEQIINILNNSSVDKNFIKQFNLEKLFTEYFKKKDQKPTNKKAIEIQKNIIGIINRLHYFTTKVDNSLNNELFYEFSGHFYLKLYQNVLSQNNQFLSIKSNPHEYLTRFQETKIIDINGKTFIFKEIFNLIK